MIKTFGSMVYPAYKEFRFIRAFYRKQEKLGSSLTFESSYCRKIRHIKFSAHIFPKDAKQGNGKRKFFRYR